MDDTASIEDVVTRLFADILLPAAGGEVTAAPTLIGVGMAQPAAGPLVVNPPGGPAETVAEVGPAAAAPVQKLAKAQGRKAVMRSFSHLRERGLRDKLGTLRPGQQLV